MGQLLSSAEELSGMKAAFGSLLYEAMLEGGAVPNLAVVHPLVLANQEESGISPDRLMEQLQQLQSNIGSRAPTYLRDLIGRLSTFSDEPHVAGLLGLVVTMVMDMAYSSSKTPMKGGTKGSATSQRILELQEVMEEYLKRCKINLSDNSRLIQDSLRLEGQISLILTQLKASLLGGDCDSNSLRYWASAAIFHSQMLVQIARLEEKVMFLSARAALEHYREDLAQLVPAYRRYKSKTIRVIKCRGSLADISDLCGEAPEEGAMTGLTVMDRESGRSVTIPLCRLEEGTKGRRTPSPGPDGSAASPQGNLDLVTTDQYAQAYLDQLFSKEGPVAELENYFTQVCQGMTKPDEVLGTSKSNKPQRMKKGAVGTPEDCTQRDESLKLSIVETQAQ